MTDIPDEVIEKMMKKHILPRPTEKHIHLRMKMIEFGFDTRTYYTTFYKKLDEDPNNIYCEIECEHALRWEQIRHAYFHEKWR